MPHKAECNTLISFFAKKQPKVLLLRDFTVFLHFKENIFFIDTI